jgi:PAS domain S-box-containing protein
LAVSLPRNSPVKFNSRIFGLSLVLGIVFWLIDAAIETFIFHESTFARALLLDVSPQELVHRVIVLALLMAFGFIISGVLFRWEISERDAAKRVLEESEARFRALADLLPEPVFEADLDRRVTYANKRAFELFGYGPEELESGLHSFDVLVPSDRPRAEAAFKKRMEGGDPGVTEYTGVRKDGTTFPMLFHAVLAWEGDRPVGIRGVVIDITDRKRAEEGLRQSEEKFRNIVESSPMGVFLYRLEEDGRLVFLDANPAADHILGVNTSGFVGKTIEEAFPPLAETEVPDHYRRAASEGTPWQTQQLYYDHGGIRGAYEVSAFQTAPNQVAVMFLDITERKKAEDAMRASEERLRSVVEQLNDATYILFEGRFDLVNHRFCQLTGVTPEEAAAPGFQFWELVAPGSIPVIRKRQEQRERGEEVPGIYEFEIKHRDGHLVQVEASVTEIDYRGGRAVLGLLRDITEKKSLKQQLVMAQKLESIGRLSGGVAHDLNNLLTPIIGFGDLVLDGLSAEDENRESVQEILQAAYRARSLVRQLLAFSRRQAMDFRAVDLNRMVEGFRGLLRRAIREDIDLRFLPSPSNPVIRGDPGQLEQVIMNLAVNAQDAMPEGGTLTIETSEVELDEHYAGARPGVTPGRYAALTFTDTGAGMDADTRNHVFEPFFTTKERGKGTGLGLATVYGIVKQHDGNIWAYSEPGEGSTFKCYLPLADVPALESVARQDEVADVAGSETVMVVEDEEAVRGLAVKVLTGCGYTVHQAADGSACLEFLREFPGPLHLLLTDVVMPGMNGRELYREVAKIFPEARVLYMSGYPENIMTRRGVLDEGIPFVQKPFSVRRLAAGVRAALDRSSKERD